MKTWSYAFAYCVAFGFGCDDPAGLVVACPHACYTGPKATAGVGLCHAGTPTCDAQGAVIRCDGEVTPKPETCDGRDEDCDGFTDADDPSLTDARVGQRCGPENVGECQTGFTGCVGGQVECLGARWPTEEICDGRDNSCSGIIDDVASRGYCYTGPPGTEFYTPCHPGVEQCIDGNWVCTNEVKPQAEICNIPGTPTDDDCDGLIDEGLTPSQPVDIVLEVDCSGSMAGIIVDVRAEAIAFVTALAADPRYRFAVVYVPGPGNGRQAAVMSDFKYAPDALPVMERIDADKCGAYEPTYDVVYDVARSNLPLSWRQDSLKVQILFTDETAQSYRNPLIGEDDVTQALLNDNQRLFVYTVPLYFREWDDPTAQSGGALFDIYNGGRSLNRFFDVNSYLCN